MPADQAAGLRRRGARQPLPCIHCFSESADSSVQLAVALHQMGRESLLVDMHGRLFGAAATRSLFDWRRQIEHGQLQTLPQRYGKGWHAPGLRSDEPALQDMAPACDQVIFDAGWSEGDPGLRPGVAHTVVVAIRRSDESMRHAYALLKTLAQQGSLSRAGLLGDPGACDRVRAACCRFLGQRLAPAIFSVANEGDAFAALAVRMTGEETGLTAC
ncbi:MAG: MinD/ParA family ATP-binding protein [Thiobacillus sp.]